MLKHLHELKKKSLLVSVRFGVFNDARQGRRRSFHYIRSRDARAATGRAACDACDETEVRRTGRPQVPHRRR